MAHFHVGCMRLPAAADRLLGGSGNMGTRHSSRRSEAARWGVEKAEGGGGPYRGLRQVEATMLINSNSPNYIPRRLRAIFTWPYIQLKSSLLDVPVPIAMPSEPDAVDDGNRATAAYTLHYFPFSLYSIMARYTAVLGASAHQAAGTPSVHVKLVNIHYEALDNLSETYLREINPTGLIPVLTGGRLTAPLPESLDISYLLAREHFPALLPDRPRATIEDLLRRLHSFEAFSICCRVDDEDVCVEYDNV